MYSYLSPSKFLFVLLLPFLVNSCATQQKSGKIPLKTRLDLALKQEIEMTKDPATGEVPRERLIKAKIYKDQSLSDRAKTVKRGCNFI